MGGWDQSGASSLVGGAGSGDHDMPEPGMVHGNAPGDKVPEGNLLIPMSLSEENMRHAVLQYLAQQGAPTRMIEAAMQVPVVRMFLPCYVFSGRFEAKWSASIAYQRGLNAGQWMPANGENEGSYAAIVYAGNHLPEDLAVTVEQKVDVSLFRTYADLLSKGFEIEAFAGSSDAAYRKRGRDNIDAAIIDELARLAPGDLHDQWACNSHYSTNVVEGFVPVGVVQLSYRGTNYDFLVDGAKGELYAVPPRLPRTDSAGEICMAVLPALCAIAAWVLWLLIVSFPLLPPQPLAFILCCTLPYVLLRRHALRAYDRNMVAYTQKLQADPQGCPPPTRGLVVSMIRRDWLLTPLLCIGATLFVLYPPAMWAEQYALENGYDLDASGRPAITRPSIAPKPKAQADKATDELTSTQSKPAKRKTSHQ